MKFIPKLKKSNQANRPRSTRGSGTKAASAKKSVKVRGSLRQRLNAKRDAKALRKAELLRDMPKGRVRRLFYRLQPKRVFRYWFSREGLIMALKLTGVGIVVMFVLLVGLFAYFRKDLPNLRDISGDNIGGSIRYYDKTGQTLLWEDYDAVKRIPVQSDQISQFMKDATVAVEDRDFYKHGGFDLKGIIRAGFANLFGGSTTQGGSTITQQLVKLTQDWTRDRSYTRKVKELILSVEFERSYSKAEILTGYLNAAPYGNIEYGVEAAARDYFQKSAKDLSLDEATFLAAIPKSPSYYSPYGPYFNEGGKEDVIGRQHYALDVMAELGAISKDQRDEAKKIDILAKVKNQPAKYGSITAPYFVLAAKEQLDDKFSGEQTYTRGGWKVTTTLDMGLQKIAEEQVQKGLTQIKSQGGDTAAFTAEDVETGQVVALVGGVDFTNATFGQNNYARLPLPPGSSFKPYDYSALIENTTNFGAGSVLYDEVGVLPGYPCTNKARPKQGGNCLWDFDFAQPGPLTLRYALGGSRNIPAVKAMLIVGVNKTIDVANALMNTGNNNAYGYKCYVPGAIDFIKANEDQCYGSSAIGDGAYLKQDEHVHGFATLSRNGVNLPQTYILKIEDSSGKTIDEWKPSAGTQAVRPDTAYIVADMLSDPNASYFQAGRKPHRHKDWKFGMKTGTTNDGKDGWMMGFSPKYAAGVWVGYHDRTKVMSGFMERMTQPIWEGWMDAVHDNLPATQRAKPSTVQTLPAYIVRSHVGLGSVEPSPSTDLFPSWYQNKNGTSNNKKRIIDVLSNKLATECTPELAKKELDDSNASNFSGDTFVTGQANTDQKDDVHKCTDERPGVSASVSGGPGNSYTLTVTISKGTHALNGNTDKGGGKVSIIVDGQTLQTFDIVDGTFSYSANYTPPSSATKTISAQVIDSALYDSTSTSTTITPISLSFSTTATHVDLTWFGGGDSTTIYSQAGATICSAGSSPCSRAKALVPSNTTLYAKDTNDNVSPSITVTY